MSAGEQAGGNGKEHGEAQGGTPFDGGCIVDRAGPALGGCGRRGFLACIDKLRQTAVGAEATVRGHALMASIAGGFHLLK